MNYHNITHDDMLNGDGLRVVLWVAGCEHHCKECQNPVTWNPNDGIEFDNLAFQEICAQLDQDYISGITYSGGDPLHPWNRAEISYLAERIRDLYPNKTQWLYTGYSWDKIKDLRAIQYLDVIKTGSFNVKQRQLDKENHHLPHWMGDSSQELRRKIDGEWILANEYSVNKNLEESHGKECGCPDN